MGAGADKIATHYGLWVPAVYLAKTFSTAVSYPMLGTTFATAEDKRNGWSGGSLIADDGTYPIRAVFRCLVNTQAYLWKKDPQKGGN